MSSNLKNVLTIEQYDEAKYYAAYKTVRNRFRKYTPLSILSVCIKYLYWPTKDEISQLRKHPWLALLLIKWAFIDEQATSAGKKHASDDDIRRLLQAVHDMASAIRMPSQYSHHTLFFRNLAYQQFLFQRPLSASNLARQELLFASLDVGHSFRRNFRSMTGLEIEEFLTLGIMLSTRFTERNFYSVTVDWFASIFDSIERDKVQAFLDSLAIEVDELRQFFLDHSEAQRRATEYFEQTPFLVRPLVRIRSEYICSYPSILFRSLEHFAYDMLRQHDAKEFMSKFGPLFERYVQNALEYSEAQFISEECLKKELRDNGKLIDFIIAEDDANVFIDAKAVEMASKGKTTHSAEILKDRIKVSVLKAIEQAHEVNVRLLNAKSAHPAVKARTKNYLIVVTYKELYLGNGTTLYEAIAQDKLDELITKYPSEARIPFENMYFITVDELDMFAHGVKTGKIKYAAGLEKAKHDDANPLSRKFDFLLHLREWGIDDPPAYLLQAFESLCNRAKEAFSP